MFLAVLVVLGAASVEAQQPGTSPTVVAQTEDDQTGYDYTGPFFHVSKTWGAASGSRIMENSFSVFSGIRFGEHLAMEIGGIRQEASPRTVHTLSGGPRFIFPIYEGEGSGLDTYARLLYGMYRFRHAEAGVTTGEGGSAADLRFGVMIRAKVRNYYPRELHFGVEVGHTFYSGVMGSESGRTASIVMGFGF